MQVRKHTNLCNYVLLQRRSGSLYSMEAKCHVSASLEEEPVPFLISSHTTGPGSVCEAAPIAFCSPLPFPESRHQGWGLEEGVCVVITGAHKRQQHTDLKRRWVVCCAGPGAARLHSAGSALMLFPAIKISKHVDQIPPARVRIGHGTGKCWVHWCFEKPDQFSSEGFQLIGKCGQFWKISSLSSWMEGGTLPTKD